MTKSFLPGLIIYFADLTRAQINEGRLFELIRKHVKIVDHGSQDG